MMKFVTEIRVSIQQVPSTSFSINYSVAI